MMQGIPSAIDSDAEDVVWRLQTAAALWERGDRAHALVWLRRAAEAADRGKTPERAKELQRSAWILETEHGSTDTDVDDKGERLEGWDRTTPIVEAGDSSHNESKPVGGPAHPLPSFPLRDLDDQEPVEPGLTHRAPAVKTEAPTEGGPIPTDEPPRGQTPTAHRQPVRPPPLPQHADRVATHGRPTVPVAEETFKGFGLGSGEGFGEGSGASVEAEGPSLTLDGVEAFFDLPDEARRAFAQSATLRRFSEGEQFGSFALVYVLEGAVEVSATVVDAPAARLTKGNVLRARGSCEEILPLRLCPTSAGLVALWSEEAVADAFRSCPWVEGDLRAASDRVLASVGITIGPLGDRLDVQMREQMMDRLTLWRLSPREVAVDAGSAVPGILLVGVGCVDLVRDGAVVGVVRSGEFVFAEQILNAGLAPSTAQAGAPGAVLLFGDRNVAQELLVTLPPLLEVFAGM